MIKKLSSGFVACLVLLMLIIYWMASPQMEVGEYEGNFYTVDVLTEHSKMLDVSDTLRVMSWNLAWAYGLGSEGSGYKPMPEDFIKAKLDSMAQVLLDNTIDILIVQEIDFASARSHYINQADYLAKKSGLINVAPVVSWEAHYIPFPYWPPKRHFGEMKSGGALLSRYPIRFHTYRLHELPQSNAWWYNLFYLFRYSQFVNIGSDSLNFTISNNHLEAFDKANRENQAQILVKDIQAFKDDLLLFGGDLNTVPNESAVKYNFDDYTEDDYRNDRTLEILSGLTDSQEPKSSDTDISVYFTFPGNHPNRKLDYLFVNKRFKSTEVKVIDTGGLSDHRPLLITIFINNKAH